MKSDAPSSSSSPRLVRSMPVVGFGFAVPFPPCTSVASRAYSSTTVPTSNAHVSFRRKSGFIADPVLRHVTTTNIPVTTRPVITRACQLNDEHDNSAQTSQSPQQQQQQAKKIKQLTDAQALLEEQSAELDRIASSWVGSDISRWEWYERLRSRHSKLVARVEEDAVQIGEDMERLKRSLMEIDAALGTSFLNERYEITASGWALLSTLTATYLGVGYLIVHGLVMALMAYVHTSPFP